jgi:hypothetical protein
LGVARAEIEWIQEVFELPAPMSRDVGVGERRPREDADAEEVLAFH